VIAERSTPWNLAARASRSATQARRKRSIKLEHRFANSVLGARGRRWAQTPTLQMLLPCAVARIDAGHAPVGKSSAFRKKIE
jgi:hypothetical protein